MAKERDDGRDEKGNFVKNNRCSVGNHGGVPRTVTPEKDELIKLGKELVEWASEETDELRYHVNQWYSLKKNITKVQYDAMLQKPEYIDYHKKAIISLGKRYIDGSVNPSIAHRFLRLYFPDMKKEENELLILKSELARKEEKQKQKNLTDIIKSLKDGEISQK